MAKIRSIQCPTCVMCGTAAIIEVDADAFKTWIEHRANGGPLRHVQNAFPDMDADTRELLISGTHPECWNKMCECWNKMWGEDG